ncbi:hypothetical protein BDZ97DRAFT_1917930 [Flammula alnicola]|nr:hypothetical protein BDZ97DRAFT_1917930 [Flammula alnicola]
MNAESSTTSNTVDIQPPDGETELVEDIPSTEEVEGNDITVQNFSQREKAILQEVQAKIQALTKKSDRARLEREGLALKTKKWLASHAQVKRAKKATKHWTGRDVLYDLKPEPVQEKQKKLYDAAVAKGKNPKSDFNFFQIALTHVWKKLSEEDKASLRATAARWNNEGPKPEVKARKTYGQETRRLRAGNVVSHGARMLFFVSFKRPNGKIACTQLDFNDTLGNGKSYLTANASFQSAGITSRDWLQHNTTYYEPDQDVPTFSTYRPRRGLMELTTNQYGEPVLPDPEVVPSGMKGRAYWQGLLRAFLALHYELASGKAPKIPWAKFLPLARYCIKPEYMSDATLTKQEATNTDDDAAFRFSHYLSKDGDLVEAFERKLAPEIQEHSHPEHNDDADTGPAAPAINSQPKPSGKRGAGRAKGKQKQKQRTKPASKDATPVADPPPKAKTRKGKGKARQVSVESEDLQRLRQCIIRWGAGFGSDSGDSDDGSESSIDFEGIHEEPAPLDQDIGDDSGLNDYDQYMVEQVNGGTAAVPPATITPSGTGACDIVKKALHLRSTPRHFRNCICTSQSSTKSSNPHLDKFDPNLHDEIKALLMAVSTWQTQSRHHEWKRTAEGTSVPSNSHVAEWIPGGASLPAKMKRKSTSPVKPTPPESTRTLPEPSLAQPMTFLAFSSTTPVSNEDRPIAHSQVIDQPTVPAALSKAHKPTTKPVNCTKPAGTLSGSLGKRSRVTEVASVVGNASNDQVVPAEAKKRRTRDPTPPPEVVGKRERKPTWKAKARG